METAFVTCFVTLIYTLSNFKRIHKTTRVLSVTKHTVPRPTHQLTIRDSFQDYCMAGWLPHSQLQPVQLQALCNQ